MVKRTTLKLVVLLAAMLIFFQVHTLKSSEALAGNLVQYSTLTGSFEESSQPSISSGITPVVGPCCNCACGWQGCTIQFQGRDCSISGGTCNTDSCGGVAGLAE